MESKTYRKAKHIEDSMTKFIKKPSRGCAEVSLLFHRILCHTSVFLQPMCSCTWTWRASLSRHYQCNISM